MSVARLRLRTTSGVQWEPVTCECQGNCNRIANNFDATRLACFQRVTYRQGRPLYLDGLFYHNDVLMVAIDGQFCHNEFLIGQIYHKAFLMGGVSGERHFPVHEMGGLHIYRLHEMGGLHIYRLGTGLHLGWR